MSYSSEFADALNEKLASENLREYVVYADVHECELGVQAHIHIKNLSNEGRWIAKLSFIPPKEGNGDTRVKGHIDVTVFDIDEEVFHDIIIEDYWKGIKKNYLDEIAEWIETAVRVNHRLRNMLHELQTS